MLGKRLLGLIGILFLGSQVSLVYAETAITSCDQNIAISESECNSDNTGITGTISYCLSETNLQVLETTSNDGDSSTSAICKVTLTTSKINIIKLDKKESSKVTSLSSDDISKYAMFYCNDSSCYQTVGIIKDNANYYGINNDGSKNAVIKVLNEPCSSTNIGGLVRTSLTGVALCLNGRGNSVSLLGSTENDPLKYLIAIETGENSSSPFTMPEEKSNMVIEVGQNYFVHDTNYGGATDEVEVYSDYLTSELIQRKVNFCSGNILNTLQTCEDGYCTPESTESANKYLGGIKYLVEGKTYSCKSTSGTRKRASGTTKCNCLEFDESVNGLNAFIIDDDVDQTYATLIDDFTKDYAVDQNGIITGMKMYSCNNGDCKETNGYMKYNTGDTAKIAKCTKGNSGTCEVYDYTGYSCDSNKIGIINFDSKKLCTKTGEEESVEIYGEVEISGSEVNYISTGKNSNYQVYKIEGSNLIGEIVPENGYYLIDGNSKRITTVPTGGSGGSGNGGSAERKKRNIVSRAADESTTAVMIQCTNGSCTSQSDITEGYYYNAGGNHIIKCATPSQTRRQNDAEGQNGQGSLNPSDCKLVDVVAIGYYKTNDNIVACTTTSKCDVVSYSYECDDSTVGKFIQYKDGENTKEGLCLDKDVRTYPDFVASDEVNHLIKYGANSIFIDTIKSTAAADSYVDDIGIVKITKNSITIENHKGLVCVTEETLAAVGGKSSDCTDKNGRKYYTCNGEGKCVDGIKNTCAFDNPSGCSTGYHLVDSSGTNYVTNTGVDGKLYKCETANACKEISGKGYYIGGDDEIYSCNGTSANCQIVTLEESSNEHSICEVEKLYKLPDSKKYICLSESGIKAEIKDKGGRFLIEKNTDGSVNRKIFIQSGDNNTHALITISNEEIILDTDYKTKSYLKYTYADSSTNEVLIRGKTTGEECENSISEYNCNEGALCTSNEEITGNNE